MYSEDMFREGIPLTSRKFHRILDFYLFHCPVDGTSVRATTFEQQGWKGTLFSTLKREMLARASSSLKSNYYPCTKAELEVAAQDPNTRIIVCVKTTSNVNSTTYQDYALYVPYNVGYGPYGPTTAAYMRWYVVNWNLENKYAVTVTQYSYDTAYERTNKDTKTFSLTEAS